MISHMLDVINIEQLNILGFNEEYRYITFISVIIFIASFILKPIIIILSKKQYYFVLTYIITSLLFIVIALMTSYVKNELFLLKSIFQSIVLFGICFTIYILFRIIKGKVKSV